MSFISFNNFYFQLYALYDNEKYNAYFFLFNKNCFDLYTKKVSFFEDIVTKKLNIQIL